MQPQSELQCGVVIHNISYEFNCEFKTIPIYRIIEHLPFIQKWFYFLLDMSGEPVVIHLPRDLGFVQGAHLS